MCIASGVLLVGPLLAVFGQCEANELAKLTPPQGAFGRSVSVSGEVALIAGSSPFVFRFDGENWTHEQNLIPSDGAQVASAVSVSGGVAIFGVHQDDDKGPLTGSAYIFRFSGKQWVEEKKLLGGKSGDIFGFSVAVSGGVALVGAPGAGKAFVYRFDGADWVEEATLTAADPTGNFATSVALSGDVAVVGDKATMVRPVQRTFIASAVRSGWQNSSFSHLMGTILTGSASQYR